MEEFIDGNRVVSVDTMRKSDAWTIENVVDSKILMSRAGKAVFDNVDWSSSSNKPIGIVCGKGNNAGDGYVIADLLKNKGIDVEVILLFENSFSSDGRYFFDKCVNDGVVIKKYDDSIDWNYYGIIVDCIFGTGFKGNVTGFVADVIKGINDSDAYVVAVDINSGLNGDSGLGDVYIKSDLTISIGTFKFGHFKGNSKLAMKNKINCDIGIIII